MQEWAFNEQYSDLIVFLNVPIYLRTTVVIQPEEKVQNWVEAGGGSCSETWSVGKGSENIEGDLNMLGKTIKYSVLVINKVEVFLFSIKTYLIKINILLAFFRILFMSNEE